MGDYLKRYIQENYKVIKIISVCFIIGLVVGVIVYSFIDSGIKNEFIKSLKSTLDLSKNSNFEHINIIKNGIIANGILLSIMYFCSVTLFAPILICTTTFFKGFSMGIYIPVVFSVFGFSNGILVLFLLIIIPNILYVPTFIFSATNAIKFHYTLFENKESGVFFSCLRELIYIGISTSVIILSIVVEQLLTTTVINLYSAL